MKKIDIHKLRIGSKVKLRSDLIGNVFYGNFRCDELMTVHSGKWVTIEYVDFDSESFVIIDQVNSYRYHYSMEMVECIKEFVYGK